MEGTTKDYEDISLMKEHLAILKQDVKEEGNIWKTTKTGNGFIIRETNKKNIIPTCYKVEGELPIQPIDLLEKILLETASAKKTSSVESITVIKKGELENIKYELYRQTHFAVFGGMISARDFIVIRCWEFVDDELWFTVFSIEDPEFSENPNYVRGYLHQVSWYASWDSRKSVSKLAHIVHSDIKGSLPGWVVSKGVVGELCQTFPKTLNLIKELNCSSL